MPLLIDCVQKKVTGHGKHPVPIGMYKTLLTIRYITNPKWCAHSSITGIMVDKWFWKLFGCLSRKFSQKLKKFVHHNELCSHFFFTHVSTANVQGWCGLSVTTVVLKILTWLWPSIMYVLHNFSLRRTLSSMSFHQFHTFCIVYRPKPSRRHVLLYFFSRMLWAASPPDFCRSRKFNQKHISVVKNIYSTTAPSSYRVDASKFGGNFDFFLHSQQNPVRDNKQSQKNRKCCGFLLRQRPNWWYMLDLPPLSNVTTRITTVLVGGCL